MATETSTHTNVVPFVKGWRSPKEQMARMDLAEMELAQVAHDIQQEVYLAPTAEAVLRLRQRIGVLVTAMQDVESFANARARMLHERECPVQGFVS